MRIVTNNGNEYVRDEFGHNGVQTDKNFPTEDLKRVISKPDASLIECDYRDFCHDLVMSETVEEIDRLFNSHEDWDETERINEPHDRWEIDEIVLRVRKVHYPDGYEMYGTSQNEGRPIWNDHPDTQVTFVTLPGETESEPVDRRTGVTL